MRLLPGPVLGAALFLLAPGPALASGGGGEGGYHGINLHAFAVQVFGFAILFAILARYAFPPAARALRGRQERIRDALDGLDRGEASLVAAKAGEEKRFKDLEAGSIERMERALKEGAALREVLVREGDEAASRVSKKARLEAEIEHQKMLLELRNEVVEVAFAAAEGVLRKAVDAKTQAALVERFLADLDRARSAQEQDRGPRAERATSSGSRSEAERM